MTPALDSDLIVIGAGPAGMAAAITASKAGKTVILLDMQPTPGGQIYRNLEHNTNSGSAQLMAALGDGYQAGLDLIRRFRHADRIDYRPQTTVWDLRPDGVVGWAAKGRAGYLRACHVILATGAMERPTPFPGWTLPGVMTAGAVQTLLKTSSLLPQGKVVLAGTGPLLFLLAHQLVALGVRPELLAFTHQANPGFHALTKLRLGALGPVLRGIKWQRELKRAGVPMHHQITDLIASGDERVEAVSFRSEGQMHRQECDLLIVHDGIIPTHDLAHVAGLALDWDTKDRAWFPRTDMAGRAMLAEGPHAFGDSCNISISGDARLRGGAIAAAHHGSIAASAAIQGQAQEPPALRKALAVQPFLDAAFPPGFNHAQPADDVIICRCEELTAGQLRKAIATGIEDLDQLRGVTRCGMGPCQGRSCTANAARLLAETRNDIPPAPPRLFRARPPVRPISLGALAGLSGRDPALAEISAMTNFSGLEKTGDGSD